MSPFFWSLLVTLVLGVISIVALYFVALLRRHPALPLLLISLAVGALLGDSFFHLLPAISLQGNLTFLPVLLGLIIFFLLERLVLWRHCHEVDCPEDEPGHLHSAPVINLVGDLVHNFADGLIIAASFAVSASLGWATSLAVILHEIPQEIGDSSILLHYGYSRSRAAILNVSVSLTAILAVILFYVFGINYSLPAWVIPFVAGGFIYLACSDLIPELHRHHPALNNTLLQLIGITVGLFAMYFLTVLE
jgi:zinc and cadmium transporter